MNQSELGRRLELSQAYISKIESGGVNFDKLPLSTIEKLAQVLGFGMEDWSTILEGILPKSHHPISPETPFDPRTLFHPPARQERVKRPLWPNLAAMIEEKSEKYFKLRQVGWQQHLNQTRFSGGQEPDADGWFEMFRALERAGVEPEEWPEE